MELSLEDISKHLGVATDTVQRWVRQGKLPVRKKGSQYTFQKHVLKKWASKHNLVLSFNKNTDEKKREVSMPTLPDVIGNGGIYYKIAGNSVESVLKSSLNEIQGISFDLKDELFAKLVERENVLSTGIGNGIAIPHPRVQSDKLEKSMLSICFLENPIDYNAVDNKPVSVLFILLCKSLEIHLHILSTLSFCLRDSEFTAFIETAPDQGAIFDRIEVLQNEMA